MGEGRAVEGRQASPPVCLALPFHSGLPGALFGTSHSLALTQEGPLATRHCSPFLPGARTPQFGSRRFSRGGQCHAQISTAKPLSNRELELLEPRLTRRKQTVGTRSNRELSTNPCFCISDLRRAFTGHSFTQTKKGPLTASHWSFLPSFASRVDIAVTHSKQSVETFLPGPRIACRLRQGTAFYPELRRAAVPNSVQNTGVSTPEVRTPRFPLATAFGYSAEPMLDLGYVREHLDAIEKMARDRGITLDLAPFREIDTERRQLITSAERLKAERNRASEEIARMKRSGEDASSILALMKEVSDRLKRDDVCINGLDERLKQFLLTVPNIPHASVPVGKSAADNVEVRRWGAPPKFDFKPRPHWEIGASGGILDFQAAVKTGCAPGTRPREFFPRPAHARARLHRNPSAVSGEHSFADRRSPVSEICGRYVSRGRHGFVAHAHVRSGTHQPAPRRNAGREQIAGESLRLDRLLPVGGRRGGKRHARNQAPASISKSGALQVHASGTKLRRAGIAGEKRGSGAAAPGPALSRDAALHRGHGIRFRKNVRHRSVAAVRGRVHGDFVLLQHRSVSGAPLRHSLQAEGGQKRIRAHAERLRPRRGPHLDRDCGKFSAGRRIDRHPRSFETVHGRGPHSPRREYLEAVQNAVGEKSGNRPDEDHRPGRLRHAAFGFERYRECFRLDARREFYHPGFHRSVGILDEARANGLALHGAQPQLVALVRRRRVYPAVAHGHPHFRVVHYADGALGHAGLGRERDGLGVLRFHQRDDVAGFVQLRLLLLQFDALYPQFVDEVRVFLPKPNRDENKHGSHRHQRSSGPPTAEETLGAFGLARRALTLRADACRGGVNLAHQTLFNSGRRLDAGSREREQRDTSARFREFFGARRARGHVRFARSFLFALQNAEGVEVEVFRPSWMPVHGDKVRFKLSTAVRIRVFTVPSGSPVLVAISLCVNPSKYASSIAARCSVERFSKAPFTRPSNCCCATALSKFVGTMTEVSSSSSPALGLCRRSRDIARLRAITTSHPGSEPRPGSNCAALRQSWKKTSCKISSAACVSRRIRFRTDESSEA